MNDSNVPGQGPLSVTKSADAAHRGGMVMFPILCMIRHIWVCSVIDSDMFFPFLAVMKRRCQPGESYLSEAIIDVVKVSCNLEYHSKARKGEAPLMENPSLD